MYNIKSMLYKKYNGFTLIELLITISVILILASIGIYMVRLSADRKLKLFENQFLGYFNYAINLAQTGYKAMKFDYYVLNIDDSQKTIKIFGFQSGTGLEVLKTDRFVSDDVRICISKNLDIKTEKCNVSKFQTAMSWNIYPPDANLKSQLKGYYYVRAEYSKNPDKYIFFEIIKETKNVQVEENL